MSRITYAHTKYYAALFLASFTLFAGCKKGDQVPHAPSKTLHLYLQTEPLSLDPRIGGNRMSQMLLRELFEGLTRVGEDGKPHPAQAEKVDISENGKIYTFTIRQSLWSSGEPVTAHDFEYAWKCILDPTFPSGFSYAFAMIKGAREAKLGKLSLDSVGIKAIDDQTLVVELLHPAPYFLELISIPIYSPVSKKAVQLNQDWAKKGGTGYVCNGPFTLADWKHHQEIILQKNERYYAANTVSLQSIDVAIVEDPQTALQMYEKGELDWVGEPFGSLPLDVIPILKQQGILKTSDIGGVYWFKVNVDKPVLSSQKIRQALAY